MEKGLKGQEGRGWMASTCTQGERTGAKMELRARLEAGTRDKSLTALGRKSVFFPSTKKKIYSSIEV